MSGEQAHDAVVSHSRLPNLIAKLSRKPSQEALKLRIFCPQFFDTAVRHRDNRRHLTINIAANIDALSAIPQIAQVATYDGPVPLTVAQAMENGSLLSKGGIGFNDTAVPVPVAIVDTASLIAGALSLATPAGARLGYKLTLTATPASA